MVPLEQLRRLAMGLVEVTCEDHHGMESFRVRGRIFATVPDDRHVRVMVDEPAILAAVEERPGACEPCWWGKHLACVVVDLHGADLALVEELITEAWMREAPKSLLRGFDGRP